MGKALDVFCLVPIVWCSVIIIRWKMLDVLVWVRVAMCEELKTVTIFFVNGGKYKVMSLNNP